MVFILFFIGLTFISAQDSNLIEGIPAGGLIADLAKGDGPSENIEDVLDRIRQKRNDSDNGYLISQWKDQLLDNENIAAVNAVFAENDIIFNTKSFIVTNNTTPKAIGIIEIPCVIAFITVSIICFICSPAV